MQKTAKRNLPKEKSTGIRKTSTEHILEKQKQNNETSGKNLM